MAEEDVGATADKIMKDFATKLTTGQIRKFLTAVNTLTSKIEVEKAQNSKIETLPENFAMEIKYLKVKIAYQAGRDKNGVVKKFVEKAKLFERIDDIDTSLEKYEKFARYVEALVAYHKFYGGKD